MAGTLQTDGREVSERRISSNLWLVMARPIKNKSNYWSQHHYGILIMLAKQTNTKFNDVFDINELINVGWFRQARYHKSVKFKAKYIKREMYNWAIRELSQWAEGSKK